MSLGVTQHIPTAAFFLSVTLSSGCLSSDTADDPASWPGFLGLRHNHTDASDLPLTWSPTENLAWIADPPGYGQSTPVIWDGQVFVTSLEGAARETLHLT